MSGADIDPARDILASSKYSGLAPELVLRVVRECREKTGGARAAEKTARRKLHQIYAAYADHGLYRIVEKQVARLEARAGMAGTPLDPADSEVRAICREVLGCHASTAERVGHLEGMYGALRAFLGPTPARVLDLGCGLGPFALPWLGLPPSTSYHALDVDLRLAALEQRYLAVTGRPGEATAADLVGGHPPAGPWDGVLLLKLLPTLERQAAGAAAALVRTLDTDRLVISYARTSLGGRRKGMDEQYAREHAALEESCGLTSERLVYATETVYLSRRR